MGTTRNRLTDLEVDFVSLVAAGDDPEAQVVIAKAAPVDASTSKSGESAPDGSTLSPSNPSTEDRMGTIDKTGLDQSVLDYIDGLETEIETFSAQVEKAEADLAAKDTEIETLKKSRDADISKSDEDREKELLEKADPAVRHLIEKSQREAREATEIAKAERDARLQREALSKAESLPHVPGERSDLAGLFRRLADALTPEDAAEVEKTFRVMNEQIEQSGLFKTLGHGGGETTISKTVQAKADEIKKADPTLTDEQALAKAYEQSPDLAMQAVLGQEN